MDILPGIRQQKGKNEQGTTTSSTLERMQTGKDISSTRNQQISV